MVGRQLWDASALSAGNVCPLIASASADDAGKQRVKKAQATRAGLPMVDMIGASRGYRTRLPGDGQRTTDNGLIMRVGVPKEVKPDEYRVEGTVLRLRTYFVDSPVTAADGAMVATTRPATTVAALTAGPVPQPTIIRRAAWNADETIVRGAPSIAPRLRFSVVHHTAGSNSYSAAQSAARFSRTGCFSLPVTISSGGIFLLFRRQAIPRSSTLSIAERPVLVSRLQAARCRMRKSIPRWRFSPA